MNFQIVEKVSNQLYFLEKQNSKKTAITYMVIAQLCFCFMYATIGYLRKEYSTIQILYIRMVFGFILNTSFCKAKDLQVYVNDGKALQLLIWRGVFGALGMILMFISLGKMNISDAVVIQNLAPIWTNVMAVFFLGEQFSKKAIICFIFGFTGIILMSRPEFIFHDSNNSQIQNQNQNQFIGSIFALLGSLSVASLTITLKKLTSIYKCHNVVQQQYSYAVTILTTGFLLIIYDKGYYEILNAKFLGLCFVLSLIGWIGQLLFSRSFGLEKTSTIAPISYIQSFITFLVDLFLFGSHIELTSILGSILIIVGSLGVIL